MDDQFGVWDDQGSNRKTSNKSPTTSSEMRVAGNASSSYKDRRAGQAGPGLNIIEKQIYIVRLEISSTNIPGGGGGAVNLSLIDKTLVIDSTSRHPVFLPAIKLAAVRLS